MYYQQLPGTNGGPESSYDAAYPFGAGLSYTTYAFTSVKAADTSVRAKDTVRLRVGVSNSGSRAGDLVVPVYVSQPTSDVLSPVAQAGRLHQGAPGRRAVPYGLARRAAQRTRRHPGRHRRRGAGSRSRRATTSSRRGRRRPR